MAKLRAIFTVLVILACVSKKPVTVARKEDCQNCKNRAAELHRQIKMKLDEIKPTKNPAAKLDHQVEMKLAVIKKLVEPESEGQCNPEYRETINRTCQEVLNPCYPDVVKYLYEFEPKLPDIDSLVNHVCQEIECPRPVSKLAHAASKVSSWWTGLSEAFSMKMRDWIPQ